MTMTTVEIARQEPDSKVAEGLLQRYYEELASRFPDGFDVGQTVAAPPAELRPPYGAFLVVQLNGDPVGCGAVRRLDENTAEIKRMWIDPVARGQGVGKRLLAELEATALELGCHVLRLDTSAHLAEAISLYVSVGYREIPAYNENRYAAHWFEKLISTSREGARAHPLPPHG